MMKTILTKYLLIQLGWLIIFILSAACVSAQNLPVIPKEWPINYQNDLLPRKELVEKHFKEYDLKIDKYNDKCGDGKIPPNDNALKAYCAKWSDELDAESLALDKEKEDFMIKFHDYEKIYAAYLQTKTNEKILEAVRKDSMAYNSQLLKLSSEIIKIKVPPPEVPRKIHEGVILGLFNTDEINAITDTSKHVVSPFTGKQYKPDEYFATSDRISAKELCRGLMDNNYLGEYTLNTAHGKKLIERLEGTKFDRLIAHSNGATVAEALIRKGVIKVDELNIIGGDRSLINALGYNELIATGKVKRIVVWYNPGDVIPMGSTAAVIMSPIVVAKQQYLDMAFSYLSTLVIGKNQGGDTKVEYRRLEGDQYEGQQKVLSKKIFDAHGFEIYQRNIQQYLKGEAK